LDVSTSFVYKHRENKPEAVTYERGGKKVTRARQVKKLKNVIEAPLDDPKETVVEEKNKEVIDYLSKEVETLSDKLAVASLEGSDEDKQKAKETIESLREEVRLLQIDNRSLKASMDKYQGENAELKKQVAMLTKRLKKFE
jgi:ABC-type phosphate transport system auxiliary subunit